MFKRFNQDSAPSPLTKVALVVAEMMLGLLLRFDKRMRQIVYPLVQNSVVVGVRVYLPNVQFYASFCEHGILLDTEAPFNKRLEANAPDVVISGSSMSLIRTLSGSHSDKLSIRGNADHEALVVQAIHQLHDHHGLTASLLEHIRAVPFVSLGTLTTDEDIQKQLKGQAETISELSLALREADYQLRRQNQRQRNLIFIVVALLFCSFVLGAFMWMD